MKPKVRVKAASRHVDNIVSLNCQTCLDISPRRVLAAAIDAELTGVVVAGLAPDGSEYFASSMADGAEILWIIERMKFDLLTSHRPRDPNRDPLDPTRGTVLPFPRPDGDSQ